MREGGGAGLRAVGQRGPVRTIRFSYVGRNFSSGAARSIDWQQPPPPRERDGLRAVVGAKLVEDGGDVELHGPLADAERRGDLSVGLTNGYQSEHRELARGQQPALRQRTGGLAGELRADRGGDVRITAVNLA